MKASFLFLGTLLAVLCHSRYEWSWSCKSNEGSIYLTTAFRDPKLNWGYCCLLEQEIIGVTVSESKWWLFCYSCCVRLQLKMIWQSLCGNFSVKHFRIIPLFNFLICNITSVNKYLPVTTLIFMSISDLLLMLDKMMMRTSLTIPRHG